MIEDQNPSLPILEDLEIFGKKKVHYVLD